MINLLALAVTVCLSLTRPCVITQPGVYDFRGFGPISTPNGSGIKVEADDVTLLGPSVRDSWECIEVNGRKRLTIRGGTLDGCTKMAIRLSGGGEDPDIEGMTITRSGNGILAYTKTGESMDGLLVVGNVFRDMRGPLDGHAIGIQSTKRATIEHNTICGTVGDAIAVYWNGSSAEQSGVRVRFNSVCDAPVGISFRATNSDSRLRFDNVAERNTVLSPIPFYVTGARTPTQYQWSVEVIDNYAPGESVIRSTGAWCPRVYMKDSGAWIGGCQ
jgi:hypothetical protein